ncbi:MAG: hypothetical protein OXG11_01295 [Chloroflexi bacterium]|nr:hypothetical protein [Chloroflexota bacterium]
MGPRVVAHWRRTDLPDARDVYANSHADLQQAVDKAIEEYRRFQRAYAVTPITADATARIQVGLLAVATSTAAGAAVGGPYGAAVGSILGVVGGTAAALAGGTAYERSLEHGRAHARSLLRRHRHAILGGLSYDELQALPPEQLRDRFVGATSALQDALAQSRNGPARDFAVDVLLDTLVNTTSTQLDQAVLREEDIAEFSSFARDLQKDLDELGEQLDRRLDDVETSMDGVAESVADLEGSVENLGERMEVLGSDQALVAEFIFDLMPPSRKANALRRGFLADRFRCRDRQDDCDAAKLRNLKDALIDLFDADAKREQRQRELAGYVRELGEVAAAVGNLSDIATNLGVNSPELRDLARYSGGGSQAFKQYVAQDYLGAFATVTGLLGPRRDPDAERFSILVGYLDRQFSQVNAKLDRVLDNQVRILEGLASVSEQIAAGFQGMDRTLSRMEFEQQRTGDAVRTLVWTPWRACSGVYDQAMTREPDGRYAWLDPESFTFTSEAALRDVIQSVGETQVLRCLTQMQDALASLRAAETFGNFVQLDWVLGKWVGSEIPEFETQAEKTTLQDYAQGVVLPARTNMAGFVEAHSGLSFASAFAMLTHGVESTDDWRALVEEYKSGRRSFVCWSGPGPHARLYELLCPELGDGTPDENAAVLLSSQVVADVVNDIAKWVLVMAQFADIRDQVTGRWVCTDPVSGDWRSCYEMLLDAAERSDWNIRRSTGEDLVEDAIAMLDVAIAAYAMVYGPMAANHIVDRIGSGRMDGRLIEALRRNSYLAANVAQLLLEERYTARTAGRGRRQRSLTWYGRAYEVALTDRVANLSLLERAFGDDLVFGKGDAGPQIGVHADGEMAMIDLPAPGAFVAGRLRLPPRYYELLATRNRLADRLYEYRMLDGLTESERLGLGVAFGAVAAAR